MAAYYYTLSSSNSDVFHGNQVVHHGINIPFLENLINANSMVIVNEVTIQNRDTVQYFLTFNDVVSWFYFGKGLGSLSVSGVVLAGCHSAANDFPGVQDLYNAIGKIRGKAQTILFGGFSFKCVLSNYTFRANADEASVNMIDFNLQMEIVDHQIPGPSYNPSC
jgi:hypothetical protein